MKRKEIESITFTDQKQRKRDNEISPILKYFDYMVDIWNNNILKRLKKKDILSLCCVSKRFLLLVYKNSGFISRFYNFDKFMGRIFITDPQIYFELNKSLAKKIYESTIFYSPEDISDLPIIHIDWEKWIKYNPNPFKLLKTVGKEKLIPWIFKKVEFEEPTMEILSSLRENFIKSFHNHLNPNLISNSREWFKVLIQSKCVYPLIRGL